MIQVLTLQHGESELYSFIRRVVKLRFLRQVSVLAYNSSSCGLFDRIWQKKNNKSSFIWFDP